MGFLYAFIGFNHLTVARKGFSQTNRPPPRFSFINLVFVPLVSFARDINTLTLAVKWCWRRGSNTETRTHTNYHIGQRLLLRTTKKTLLITQQLD